MSGEREWAVRFPSGRIVSHGDNEESARASAADMVEMGFKSDVLTRRIPEWEVAR